jgi:hypothetical protein
MASSTRLKGMLLDVSLVQNGLVVNRYSGRSEYGVTGHGLYLVRLDWTRLEGWSNANDDLPAHPRYPLREHKLLIRQLCIHDAFNLHSID